MAMQFGEWRVGWLYDGDEADRVGGQGRTGCDACRYQATAFGRSAVVVSRARPSAHTVIKKNRQLAFGLQDRLACQSVSVLCRFRWVSLHRADGARTVRNGSAQCRSDQMIGTTTISEKSQRSPLVLTKRPFEDRTGSHDRCRAARRCRQSR